MPIMSVFVSVFLILFAEIIRGFRASDLQEPTRLIAFMFNMLRSPAMLIGHLYRCKQQLQVFTTRGPNMDPDEYMENLLVTPGASKLGP